MQTNIGARKRGPFNECVVTEVYNWRGFSEHFGLRAAPVLEVVFVSSF